MFETLLTVSPQPPSAFWWPASHRSPVSIRSRCSNGLARCRAMTAVAVERADADSSPTQCPVPLLHGHRQGVGHVAAEQLAQVDLQPADRPGVRPRDRRRLVLREDDRLLRTDPAARRAPLLALVLILHQDALQGIDAVDA